MSDSDTSNWRTETRSILTIGAPLIVNNLAVAGMQFVDTVMAGRLGASSLAAAAVGGSVWFLGFALVLGIMMAISPIAARHFGAGNFDLIGRYTRQGIYLGCMLGVVAIVLMNTIISPLLTAVQIDPAFRDNTVRYVGAIACGAPGIFMFLAMRFTTEGVGFARPLAYVAIFSFCANVFLNWVLAFGKFGVPAFGVIGLGYASAITMWLVCLLMAAVMMFNRRYRPFEIFTRTKGVRPAVLREIVSLGIPISVTVTAEVGLFAAISVLMGTRGTNITAAHQIALNYATTAFMIPLALSAATTVRVGHLLGGERPFSARLSGMTGILLCGVFMAVSAAVLLLFRNPIVAFYTSDPAVREIAISLLLIAAVFQVADGIQVGAAGALRGYKDTRVPMLINTVSYWVLAFPLAFLAAITFRLPPNTIWLGFVVGLGAAAILLSRRFLVLSARQP